MAYDPAKDPVPAPQTWIRGDGTRITVTRCGNIETYTEVSSSPWSVKTQTFFKAGK